jgi:hypothetical protein
MAVREGVSDFCGATVGVLEIKSSLFLVKRDLRLSHIRDTGRETIRECPWGNLFSNIAVYIYGYCQCLKYSAVCNNSHKGIRSSRTMRFSSELRSSSCATSPLRPASVPEVPLCAFHLCTNDVNTPLEEIIESLIRVFFVRLLIPLDEGLELSKELLNRIQV